MGTILGIEIFTMFGFEYDNLCAKNFVYSLSLSISFSYSFGSIRFFWHNSLYERPAILTSSSSMPYFSLVHFLVRAMDKVGQQQTMQQVMHPPWSAYIDFILNRLDKEEYLSYWSGIV